MVAQITRFYTRAELGMRAPRSVSYNLTPNQGGAAVHYGGAGPNPAPSSFAAAKSIWLGWQDYHMDGHGWADIAYSAGYDNLGNVYAGRGLGIRTAAQGTNEGNDDNYAFVWIGGGSATPSQAAFDALEWLVKYGREKGGAGTRVRPHMSFTGTDCPGLPLKARAMILDGNPIATVPTSPTPTPAPKPSSGPAKISVDGKMGPSTIELLQIRMKAKGYKITVDGKISDKSQVTLALQKYLNKKGLRDRNGKTLVEDGKGLRSNNSGKVGPTHTIEALQRYLRTTTDGVLSSPTSSAVRRMQELLNSNKF